MKPAVSIVLLFLALTLGWSQQERPSNTNQRNATAQQPKPGVPVPDNETKNDKQPTESHPEQPTWWNVARGTWALVIVGIFGTGAALWTLRILNGQLKEMKRAGEQAGTMIAHAETQA